MNPARHTISTPAFLQLLHDQPVVILARQALRRDRLRRDSSRRRARQARRAFAVADHEGNFRAGDSPGRNAIGQRLEIRSAPGQQHANAM